MNIPQHIGIILDGNRRWARQRGLTTFQGHQKGFNNVRKIALHAFDKGVKILTVYAFSTENWNRSKIEVNYLMKLFKRLVNKEADELKKKNIKLKILGNVSRFDKELQEGIKQAELKTKNGKKGLLNICLNYGGHEEIAEAVKQVIKDKIPLEEINKELLSKYMYTRGLPNPDLIIRFFNLAIYI